ncbi:hypothetical protein NLG97_g10023 [Lecanicillium saksenae]|uniref:Uncharacterized protein n=1 Tax=Lecanicillium saksenae TaxID=468837 RepID=A0ACC1QFU9_9HYPO|nr:hypothetical protein NLG97_g10023 [Lecanicillium saksenae]
MIAHSAYTENLSVSNVVAVVGAAFIVSVFYRAYFRDTASIPGPWYTNWTRLVYTYKALKGEGPAYIQALHDQYGSTVRISPGCVAISEISDVQQVYNTKEVFVKSKFYDGFGGPKAPRSVFSTSSVDTHRRYRRLLGGPMSESSLKLVTPEVRSRAEKAMDRIEEEMDQRGAADVNKWFLFFTTDTIGDLAFGQGFNMLESGVQNQYSIDLHSLAKTGAIAIQLPSFVKYSRYVPFVSAAADRARQTLVRMADYARQSIARQKASEKTTLFSRIIRASEENLMTEPELVANAQSYLVAGTDTTSNTLTYLVWAVSRDETIRQTLLAELSTLPDDFSDAELKPLEYLDHVIQESLRLYSAAPALLPRLVPACGAVLSGYQLSPGTEIAAQAYTMHRNPKVFSDPYTFNPSRWENPTKEMKDSMTAFGRGNRVCLGLHLALIELRLATALFFTRFPTAKMSALEGMSDKDMEPVMHFLASPAGSRCLMEA